MHNKILKYLNRPFPSQIGSKYKWFDTLGIAFIISLALILFQPFGINELHINYKTMLLSGFGVIYAIVNTIYYFISPSFLKKITWTVKHEIIVSLLFFFVVGLANWIYAVLWIPIFSFSFVSLLQFQYYTLVFGALPVVSFSLIIENTNLKSSIKTVQAINKAIEKQDVVKTSNSIQINGFSIEIDDVLYFNSYQNYVDIILYQNNEIKKIINRSTLKHIKFQLVDYPQFAQCHKSFIVNTKKIQKTEGNALGLILTLKNCSETVPVSRSFVTLIKDKFINRS